MALRRTAWERSLPFTHWPLGPRPRSPWSGPHAESRARAFTETRRPKAAGSLRSFAEFTGFGPRSPGTAPGSHAEAPGSLWSCAEFTGLGPGSLSFAETGRPEAARSRARSQPHFVQTRFDVLQKNLDHFKFRANFPKAVRSRRPLRKEGSSQEHRHANRAGTHDTQHTVPFDERKRVLKAPPMSQSESPKSEISFPGPFRPLSFGSGALPFWFGNGWKPPGGPKPEPKPKNSRTFP